MTGVYLVAVLLALIVGAAVAVRLVGHGRHPHRVRLQRTGAGRWTRRGDVR